MKNTAKNTLTYTGEVTLSQYIGTKKVKVAQVHNTGRASLFEFLSDCLVGDVEIAKAKRPTKIRMLQREADYTTPGAYTYTAVSGFIYLLTAPEKSNSRPDQCSVRYSFLIPKDFLGAVTNFNTLGLGLYTDSATDLNLDIENFAAFCLIGSSSSNVSISTNASLAVDWELTIENRATDV